MASPAVLVLICVAAGLMPGCSGSGKSTSETGDIPTTEGVTETATTATTTATPAPATGDSTTTGIMAPDTGNSTPTSDSGTADGCLGDADCGPAQCVGPTGEVCSECLPTMRLCASDTDCAVGDVCIEYPVACGCDVGFTTICTHECMTSADCDAGGECNPESSHCLYDSCVGDADCPPLFACVPVLGGNSCRRRNCESGEDCADGVCVDAYCHTGPGACIPTI